MPQHITAVLRTTPANRTSSGVRKSIRRRPSKRISLLQALPPADTISPTTPTTPGNATVATRPTLGFITKKRHPLERPYPSSECLPLSAAALERSVPSPNTPLAKEESETRIGVWRDGVLNSHTNGGRTTIEQKEDSKPTQPLDWPLPATAQAHLSRRSSKPTLSVVIPDCWSPKTKDLTRKICQDFAATATTPAVSKFNMTAHILPSATGGREINHLGYISSLADHEDVPMTAPPAMVQQIYSIRPMTPPERSNPSRNSSNASTDPSYIDSDGSTYSRKSSKSSRTSIDSADDTRPKTPRPAWKGTRKGKKPMKPVFAIMDPAKAGVFDSPNPDLNKPLPPSPGPEPSRFDPSQSWTSLPRASPKPGSISSATPESIQSGRGDHGWNTFQRPYMRPSNPINWNPVRVKTSKSCKSLHKLDMFDDEFMKTDPYVSSTPTSPSMSEAASELKDKLCEIKPLQIRRKSRPALRRTVSADSTSHSSEEDNYLPRINVTRTGSASSEVSTVPTIPPKSTLRSARRASAVCDSIISPDTPSLYRISDSQTSTSSSDANALKIVVTSKSLRRRSGSDFDREGLTPLRLHHLNTPVTARLAPQLPALTPVPRLLSPRTPSARISILIPSTLSDENTLSLTGLDESWRPHSPQKFQTARAAAETALLHIMSSLPTFEDLANTAVINKGMRRVYKQNELCLLKCVLRNESPAAWELREWSPPPSPDNSAVDPDIEQQNYTAMTYRSHANRDRAVIAALKRLIVARCATFLRPETVAALEDRDDANAARFDEAFYRIWCFCRIFGSGKHREEDITGQIDWLKGGLLAHAQGCAATVNTNLEFDMASVLLNPPEWFGDCNQGGLTASELYDMTELWNCLAALLGPYVGEIKQAGRHGIFAGKGRGDKKEQQEVLEEWLHHVLTLGLDAVLKLAELGEDTNAGFALAALNGWMEWSPPAFGSSRAPFLREPLARLYADRVTISPYGSNATAREQERKELGRKRVAMLAAEIRAARCTSGYQRLPLIDLATERPMSLFSRMTASNRGSVASSVTLVGRTPIATPVTALPRNEVEAWRKKVSPIAEEERTLKRYAEPTGTGSPEMEEEEEEEEEEEYLTPAEELRRARRQSEIVPRVVRRPPMPPRLVTNSADIAVQNVVSMGFTPGQAREALKMTDSGDGLHVDRAVNWLLRHSS
ncbi:hypothetical protein CAC42_6627 [Sphaceloma murrayae]|uniref:UBA domain-containing protein n=1 Tax=Sphaceloma murrayae TaxID=2082308 RepID=A0A2K1QG10_9PEZI|nr:hypothetical protein CAC42_6627 [Sphaceloma murrayae]